jgi:hypothetical protein
VRKTFACIVAALGCGLATGVARAGDVYWSVGVNLPPVGTVISNAPVYAAPAAAYVPAPVYVEPPPVVYRPAPVYVAPPVVYRASPQVVYVERPYHHRHRHWHRHEAYHDEYGTPYREGRWVPADPRRYRHGD